MLLPKGSFSELNQDGILYLHPEIEIGGILVSADELGEMGIGFNEDEIMNGKIIKTRVYADDGTVRNYNITVKEKQDGEYYTNTLTESFADYAGFGSVTARIDADYDKFVRLTLNGAEVNKENYIVTRGSTVITLKEEFLKTLKVGTYEIAAEYNDGAKIVIPLKVIAAGNTSPGTGDREDIEMYLLVFMTAVFSLSLIGAVKFKKMVR